MDCAFAIQGTDYILIASDRSVARSIIKLQDSDDKLTLLSNTQILAACGEVSDRKSFCKLVFGELEYYYYRYNNRLDTDEVANYTRSVMAENLRKKPYQANCIVAGYDKDGPKLYWMDYLGSSSKVTKAAHGYGSNFLYGIMDNFYRSVSDFEFFLKFFFKIVNF
jgi:20S proteasome subunit beta 4